MEVIGKGLKALFGSCNMVDCCSGARSCHQFVFPCIRCCSYGDRKVFYNYDGTETVEPLVGYLKPVNSRVHKIELRGLKLSEEDTKNGLDAPGQISAIIQHACQHDLRVRAVGTGSSWSKLTNVRDILVDMTNLDRILQVTPENEAGTIKHIEVQGGKTLHDFVREIDTKYGMSLPCMGNYAGQTIAGIISTSTHGTGQDYPTMSNFVVGLHLIIANGIQVKVQLPLPGEEDECFESVERRIRSAKYGEPPLVIKSNDIFRAVAVGFGSLGVIYSVTLRCEPMYNISEVRHYIDIEWPNSSERDSFKIPDKLRELSEGEGKYFSFFVNPCPRKSKDNPDRTVLKSLYLAGDRTEDEGRCQCGLCLDFQCFACTGCRGKSACQIIQTDFSASCLQMMASFLPKFVPTLYDCGMFQFHRNKPYIHKYYNVLTFTNGNIHIKTAEYCIALNQLESALKDTLEIMQEYGQRYNINTLLPVYVRMVKSDDLYLSPANRENPNGGMEKRYCYIEVPFLPGAYGIDEFHRKLEDFLFTKYKARPHWAKNNFLTINRVRSLYPNLNKWKRVYLLFNANKTFDNEFTRKCGFEDFHFESNEIGNDRPSDGKTSSANVCEECSHRHDDQENDEFENGNIVASQPQKDKMRLFSDVEAIFEQTKQEIFVETNCPNLENNSSSSVIEPPVSDL